MGCKAAGIGPTLAILCSRGTRRAARCAACDREAVALCDYPVGARGRTCSRKLCDLHRRRVGDDRDFCPAHAATAPHVKLGAVEPVQLELGG